MYLGKLLLCILFYYKTYHESKATFIISPLQFSPYFMELISETDSIQSAYYHHNQPTTFNKYDTRNMNVNNINTEINDQLNELPKHLSENNLELLEYKNNNIGNIGLTIQDEIVHQNPLVTNKPVATHNLSFSHDPTAK